MWECYEATCCCHGLASLHASFASSTVINLFICARGGSSCLLRDLPTVSLILCFQRSTAVFSYLSYHSLFNIFFCHSFITHSFNVPKPVEHVLLHSQSDIFTSTCNCVYCTIVWNKVQIFIIGIFLLFVL